MERGMRTMNWVQGFVHKRIISAVKGVEFVNDRMSYIIPRGRWFHIIVVIVHAPTENKTEYLNWFEIGYSHPWKWGVGLYHTPVMTMYFIQLLNVDNLYHSQF
jgi:hypothetical protein